MKIAIVGSHSFNDYAVLKKFIDDTCEAEGITGDAVVSGGARGADALGERYADEYALDKIIFPLTGKSTASVPDS